MFNAIMIKGDETGNVMFYGKGAGTEATASAVVADILDCVKPVSYTLLSDPLDYRRTEKPPHKSFPFSPKL